METAGVTDGREVPRRQEGGGTLANRSDVWGVTLKRGVQERTIAARVARANLEALAGLPSSEVVTCEPSATTE